MKSYVLSMAKFFGGNAFVAIDLLTDQEFAILAVLATIHRRKKENVDYDLYRVWSD